MARVIVYDGREFPDPDPNLSIDEIRQHMANFFPELSNAETKQSKRGEDDIIEFKKRVGTKGGGQHGRTASGGGSYGHPPPSGCRTGYCTKKKVRYGGGGYEDLRKGICPICKGKLEKPTAAESSTAPRRTA